MNMNFWKHDLSDTKKSFRCELLLLWYSGRFLYLCAALLIGVIGVYWLGYANLKELCEAYDDVCALYAQDPDEMREDLEADSVFREEGAVTTIENPVRYYRDRIRELSESLQPGQSMTLACESSMLIFPALSALLGCFLGAADFRSRTIKMKVTRFGKRGYAAGKVWVLLLSALLMTGLYYFLFPVVGTCFRYFLKTQTAFALPTGTDPEGLSAAACTAKAAWLIRPILSAGLSAEFGMLGLLLGGGVKGAVAGTVLAMVYTLQPFPLGYADLASYFQNLSGKWCSYSGVIALSSGTVRTGTGLSVLVPLAAGIVMTVGYGLCIRERSAYC